jgi:hypothetical protein
MDIRHVNLRCRVEEIGPERIVAKSNIRTELTGNSLVGAVRLDDTFLYLHLVGSGSSKETSFNPVFAAILMSNTMPAIFTKYRIDRSGVLRRKDGYREGNGEVEERSRQDLSGHRGIDPE